MDFSWYPAFGFNTTRPSMSLLADSKKGNTDVLG